MWTTRCRLLLSCAIVIPGLSAGCCCVGWYAPERELIGKWQIDKATSERDNILASSSSVAADLSYEFRADGTYTEGAVGSGKKGTWKQVQSAGDVLTLELLAEGENDPETVDVTIAEHNRIKWKYREGIGSVYFRRARDHAE